MCTLNRILSAKWFKMSSELTLDEFDGSHCVDRVVSFGGNAAVAGEIFLTIVIQPHNTSLKISKPESKSLNDSQ